MLKPVITFLFAFASLNAALGALVMWRTERKHLYRNFFGAIGFSVGLWALLLAAFYLDNGGLAGRAVVLYFIHFAALISSLSLLNFTAAFPVLDRKLLKITGIYSVFALLLNIYLIFVEQSVVTLVHPTGFGYTLGAHYIGYASTMVVGFLLSFYILRYRYLHVEKQYRRQILIIFWGTFTSALFALATNLFLPAYDMFELTWLGPMFTIFLVGATFYAAVKHQLFKMELFLTEIFVLMLVILLTGDLFQTQELGETISKSIILLLTLVLSYFLVRSVQNEIEQRERAESLSSQLKDLNKELQKVDQMKTEFLSLASHQLRTPLTSIKGYASMMLEGSFGKLTAKVHEPVRRIFESSNILTKIIADLLDVSKIEQGGLQYEMQTFSLASMIQSVVDEQSINAKEKKIHLSLELKQPGKYALKGDQVKLRQVFQNLIDNAVKYTDAGGKVTVELSKKQSADKKAIRVAVVDNGRGIEPEVLKKLFQKFSRGTAGKKTNTGGSGLGLYLAKQIVKAHAGDLWAESDGPNKGSSFIAEFPQEY